MLYRWIHIIIHLPRLRMYNTKTELSCTLWTLGNKDTGSLIVPVSGGSSVIANVPCWCLIAIVQEAQANSRLLSVSCYSASFCCEVKYS